jgi:hypothetical protein
MVKRRPRISIEQCKAIINDQQASGLSRLEYCLKHDIHIDTSNPITMQSKIIS